MKPTEAATECPPESEKTERMEEKQQEDKAAAPSTSVDESDVAAEASKLIGSGNKHMVLGDYPSAVNAFQEASSLLGKKYGETADECAESYFLYGKALLELARMENGVLGNALEGVDVEEDEAESATAAENPQIESANDLDDEKMEELRDQVYDAMSEKEKPADGTALEGETPDAAAKEHNGDVDMEEPSEKNEEKTVGDQATPEEKVASGDQAMAVEESDKVSVSEGDKESEEAPAAEGESDNAPPVEGEKETTDKASAVEGDKESTDKVLAAEVSSDKAPVEKGDQESGDKAMEAEVQKESDKPQVVEGEKNKADLAVEAEKLDTSDQTPAGEAKETSENKEQKEDGEKAEVVEKEGKGEENEEKSEPMEEGEDEGCEGEDEENEEGTAEDKENEEEEEVGNLQLAWEMLDLAQVIYKRQSTKEAQLSASQAHLKLGEIGIESGNYSQAIGDFLECLKIQQKHLEAHDRLLAETHYQLGLAYNYHNQYDDAIAHFNKSAEVIEKRLAMLSERIEKGEGSEEEDKKEMEDLKELLPEIKEKIEDAKESKKSGPVAEQVLKETLTHGSSPGFPQENGSSSSSSTPASTVPIRRASDGAASSKTATDISHLVRKKRKPEEVSPQKDSEAKKPKQEATVNGSGDAAAHNGNGVAETMGEEEKPPAAVESEKAVESTA